MTSSYVVRFRDLTSGDVQRVGSKNASLGKLIRALRPAGITVPPGFATTAVICVRTWVREHLDVAVRSSATAEDLPTVTVADQPETFLNVIGEAALLDAVIGHRAAARPPPRRA